MARYLRNTVTGDITTVLDDDDATYGDLLAQRQDGEANRPLHVQVEVTDPAVTPHSGGGGGGGGSFPDFAGSGSPEGVQTAGVGKFYQDTTNGGLYAKAVGSGNTGWVAVGANIPNADNGLANLPAGLVTDLLDGPATLLFAPAGGSAVMSDPEAYGAAGTFNGVMWLAAGGDGAQSFVIKTGSTGQHAWNFNPDGTTIFPPGFIAAELDIHNASNPNGGVAAVDDYINEGQNALGLFPLPLGAATGPSQFSIYDEHITPAGVNWDASGHAQVLWMTPTQINSYDWFGNNPAFDLSTMSLLFNHSTNAGGYVTIANLAGPIQFASGGTPFDLFVHGGNPTGNVTPIAAGDLCIDITTPALWQATGTLDTDWQQIGAGGGGSFPAGFAAWGGTAPGSKPATPVTLADVIAVLQAYGMTA
jgi:hypothetical protein